MVGRVRGVAGTNICVGIGRAGKRPLPARPDARRVFILRSRKAVPRSRGPGAARRGAVVELGAHVLSDHPPRHRSKSSAPVGAALYAPEMHTMRA